MKVAVPVPMTPGPPALKLPNRWRARGGRRSRMPARDLHGDGPLGLVGGADALTGQAAPVPVRRVVS